jgi:hypothetical protein
MSQQRNGVTAVIISPCIRHIGEDIRLIVGVISIVVIVATSPVSAQQWVDYVNPKYRFAVKNFEILELSPQLVSGRISSFLPQPMLYCERQMECT